MTERNMQEIAFSYTQRGFCPIPLRPKLKIPLQPEWQKADIDRKMLPSDFANPKVNIGMLLGKPSGNLVDIDLDSPFARELAPKLLPPTDAKFGRASVGITHHLYRTEKVARTNRIAFEDDVLVELRSDGAQTMVPPSIHPNGETVKWFSEGPPALVDSKLLQRQVNLLAAGCVLLEAYPEKGRHDFSLAIGAMMAHAKFDQETVENFIDAVASAANDEERPSRVRNVKDSFGRVVSKELVWGLPKLIELIGDKRAQAFAKLIGYSGTSLPSSQTANAQHAVLALQDYELWTTPDDVGFITLKVDSHFENLKIRSKATRKWVLRNARAAGRRPTPKLVDQMIDELEADAHAGPVFQTAIRVAAHGENIYLDLGDPEWRAVEITKNGWSVVSQPPVKFMRPLGMQALPIPVAGEIEALRPFVNVESDDFVLFVSALIGALIPNIPYVILMISGEQGTAKTTISHIVRRLVDPNSASVRSLPRSEHDLFISASNSWLLVFDNVSHIPAPIADALCRISTGGSYVTRRLYSDDEEVMLDARRPTTINGIPSLATRPDLLDRSIVINLPVIEPAQRRPEKQFRADFENAAPGIFGAMCSALAEMLRNRPSVKLENAPRMADFAEAMIAAEQALGWKEGTFLKAYEKNRAHAKIDLAAQDPLIEAISKYVRSRGGVIVETATDLLRGLEAQTSYEEIRKRSWPKHPNHLSRELRRLAPVMRAMGITVDLDFERDRETKVKSIRIRMGLPSM